LNLSRFSILFKALGELGVRQVGLYGLYQLQLRSGWLERSTQAAKASTTGHLRAIPLVNLPANRSIEAACGTAGRQRTLAEADEIVAGQVRLFGGAPVPLELHPPGPLLHWTAYEKGHLRIQEEDIKWVWEAGRFGWAYTLGRAYRLCADERYPQAFWRYAEEFWEANPPYLGPHWISAQEAALRLIALVFAAQVFAGSAHTTERRLATLAGSIAEHAARIPPSLAYARAQNNNHLLSEAAGLYTAGLALPEHPQAGNWRATGWKWFQAGLQSQIDEQGAYIQNSTNYQRLMLQLALWMRRLAAHDRQVKMPDESLRRLARATAWQLARLEAASGRMPNLGPNDGARILPLSSSPFEDHRPTLQAASLAFLGERRFKKGEWDELVLWLEPEPAQGKPHAAFQQQTGSTPQVLHHPSLTSWAYLRAVRFSGRPGHADQLHLDLWWRGQNLAMDAGTYLYNAPPPWDNSLASTAVHNTLTINDRDQMTPAGRFLFVDWAQAEVVETAADRLTVRHDGYRRMGWIHQRTLQASPQGWLVIDKLLPAKDGARSGEPIQARLQWLLPDWEWEVRGTCLRLLSAEGWVELEILAEGESDSGSESGTERDIEHSPKNLASPGSLEMQIVRAGEIVYGSGEISPNRGWFSPTYGYKYAALSLGVTLSGPGPLTLTSRWQFPQG
jgi:hypothetical protein